MPESKIISSMKNYYLYMMASSNNKALYIGVTNDLIRRVYEHRNELIDGFSKKYSCKRLVWYELHFDINSAIAQEKRMKKWKREFKENLINEMNPQWKDLYEELF